MLIFLVLFRCHDVYTRDLRNTDKCHFREQRVFDLAEQLMITHFVVGIGILGFNAESNAQHQRSIVAIGRNALHAVGEVLLDLRLDEVHRDALRGRLVTLQLDAQEPWRQVVKLALITKGQIDIEINEVNILGHNGGTGIGVVVNLGGLGDVTELGVLEDVHHLLPHGLTIARHLWDHLDTQRRRLGRLAHVDNFLQPRHPESNVFGRHTGKVERV
mmetsp:Transcript_32258/g.84401  ORF Transcript_32258/g.84401 Transcript_32258/m.84401 type:complete len:216 (+) Transcript_32258:903-1550(+)